MSLRVFLDTSVLFSALHSATGSARDLLDAATDAEIDLVISAYVLNEVRRNLARKSERGSERLTAVLAAGSLAIVEPDAALIHHIAQVVEPKDAPVIAAAVIAGVPVVATYDQRHLLSQAQLIRSTSGVEVLTPDEVLRRLAADDQAGT